MQRCFISNKVVAVERQLSRIGRVSAEIRTWKIGVNITKDRSVIAARSNTELHG